MTSEGFSTITFSLMLATAAAGWLGSWGSKEHIRAIAPEYCARLYNSAIDQAVLRAMPMRYTVLFGEPVPAGLKSTITPIRWIYAANLSLIIAFFVSIALRL